MLFYSDNAAPACPQVMAALIDANRIDKPYDGDRWSAMLDGMLSDLFGRPVGTAWVSSGTAANAIALATLCPPYGRVVCHEEAHIEVDECSAPEFFMGGGKLMLCPGGGAKITPDAIVARIANIGAGVHHAQVHAVSVTNASEYGLAYRPDEVAAIGDLCRARGWSLHMDGARFANAVAHIGCDPADVTWRAGVDILSFGFIKNGGLSADLIVDFDPARIAEAKIRRKRAGHLASKGRYLGAQLVAMLTDNVWLDNARAANAAAAIVGRAAGDRLLYPVEANEIFLKMTAVEAATLRGQGFDFYDWGEGAARVVTSWDHQSADVTPFADALAAL